LLSLHLFCFRCTDVAFVSLVLLSFGRFQGKNVPPEELGNLVHLIEQCITAPGGEAALYNLLGAMAAAAADRKITVELMGATTKVGI
jgi:hypothetical protein